MVMAEQLIDGRVIEACQQGDRAAFQLLFETYKDKVFSIAVYSSGGDRTLADDVTQQIFLKLFTAIRQFRGDSEFTTWLYRLVVNACLDEKRRLRRLLPWGETVAMKNPSEKKPQEKQYARLEISEAVQAAIDVANRSGPFLRSRPVPRRILRSRPQEFSVSKDKRSHPRDWSRQTRVSA